MDSVDPAHVEAHEDREPEPDVRKRDEESDVREEEPG